MDLWKKIARVTLVAGAALWMYKDASTLPAFSVQTSAGVTALSETEQITEPESESESETATELESESESETATESESESESQSETASESESELEPESQSETASESESESESQSETASESESESEPESQSETVSESESEPESQSETAFESESELASASESWVNLCKELNSSISEYEGTWSVYVKDLEDGGSLTINEQAQSSASLIKLYIAGAVLNEIQAQNLERTDTIDQLLTEMITVSDNEAANELVRYLSDTHDHQDGLQKVNEFIDSYGFTDTHQYNGLDDSSLWYYPDHINVTSVTDCGRLLEEIYEGDFISHLISRELEGYLLNQEVTWKIPAGIPSEIKTANKTGETDNTQNDVSMVFTPYGDYIICIMATDLTDEDTAIEHIRTLSGTVYDYFTEMEAAE